MAFDLDGTLYPAYRLNFRLVPFLVKEQRLLRAFGGARTLLREADLAENSGGEAQGQAADFYETQARITAEVLNESPEIIR